MMERARSALQQGQTAEAERICRSALTSHPLEPNLHVILGHCLVAQNLAEQAARAFQSAIRIEPKNATYYFFAAVAKQSSGIYDEAEEFLDHSIRLAPHLPQPLTKLGQIKLLQGRPEDALPPLRKSIELDPTFFPALSFLALALVDTGSLDEAEIVLERAERISPGHPDLLLTNGRLLQAKGDFKGAERAFESCLAVDPISIGAYVGLTYSRKTTLVDGNVMKKMNELVLRDELSDQDRSLLFYALGKRYDDLGEYEQAMSCFDQANSSGARTKAGFDRTAYSESLDQFVNLFRENELAENLQQGIGRPIFIIGMIRSGTTLVEQTLSSHPDIATGGELSFWTEQSTNLVANQRFERCLLDRVVRIRQSYNHLLDSISETALRITDKMPTNYQFLGAILAAFPDSLIVHCRRDPMDTCLSIYTTPFLRPPGYSYDRSDIVFAYREYLRVMESWADIFPEANIFDLEYESLVREPEAVTRKLIEFTGLKWYDRCLKPPDKPRSIHTPSHWQVRQPLYGTSIERWRKYEPWLGEFRSFRNH